MEGKNLQIAICDDEKESCCQLEEILLHILGNIGQAYQISCFTDAAALLGAGIDFDMVFLDIEMPGMDGLSLAQEIRVSMPECILIFVTAFQEYVFDVFALEAADYLCKPVDAEKLGQTVMRVIRKLEGQTLLIQTAHSCKTVKLNQIYYCEVINRKIYLHLRDEVIDYYGKLSVLEVQLGSRFYKCHRSYLVNLDYLAEMIEGQAVLANGARIPVSRLRRGALMEALLWHIKGKGKI